MHQFPINLMSEFLGQNPYSQKFSFLIVNNRINDIEFLLNFLVLNSLLLYF